MLDKGRAWPPTAQGASWEATSRCLTTSKTHTQIHIAALLFQQFHYVINKTTNKYQHILNNGSSLVLQACSNKKFFSLVFACMTIITRVYIYDCRQSMSTHAEHTLSKKTPPSFYILNNSAKNEQMLIVFGVQNH